MNSRRTLREIARPFQAVVARRTSAPFVQHMMAAQQREREHITAELVKVKGFMPLLMKRRNGDRWTVDERHELIGQLNAMAHLSPYLVVLILPGSFLALPLLAWWLDRRRYGRTGSPVLQTENPNKTTDA